MILVRSEQLKHDDLVFLGIPFALFRFHSQRRKDGLFELEFMCPTGLYKMRLTRTFRDKFLVLESDPGRLTAISALQEWVSRRTV